MHMLRMPITYYEYQTTTATAAVWEFVVSFLQHFVACKDGGGAIIVVYDAHVGFYYFSVCQ